MPAFVLWRGDLALAVALAFPLTFPLAEYRWLIAGVIVVSAQMILIAALLRQRRRRRLAEKALLCREAGLMVSYRRTQQLARSLIHAQETARIALARDLHDDIGQDIISVALAIDGFTRSSGRIDDPRNQSALMKLYERAVAVADHVRVITHELHPATLQLLGLVPALKAHCMEIEGHYRTKVTVDTTGDMRGISSNSALCLFRIAQEGLRNAAMHGDARHVEISLTRFGGDIELIIRDDGCGFDVDSARRFGDGLGLVSMEERVHAAGGEVIVRSIAGGGTTVLACVPVGPVPATDADLKDIVTAPYDDEVAAGPILAASQWNDQVC